MYLCVCLFVCIGVCVSLCVCICVCICVSLSDNTFPFFLCDTRLLVFQHIPLHTSLSFLRRVACCQTACCQTACIYPTVLDNAHIVVKSPWMRSGMKRASLCLRTLQISHSKPFNITIQAPPPLQQSGCGSRGQREELHVTQEL